MCEALYKPKKYTYLKDTRIGEKNYAYKSIGDDFEKWYKEEVVPLFHEKKPWELPIVKEMQFYSYDYQDDNVFALAGILEDEDAYTNFISSILKANEKLQKRFFGKLVSYVEGWSKTYTPSRLNEPITQKEALVEDKKTKNKQQRKKPNGSTCVVLFPCTVLIFYRKKIMTFLKSQRLKKQDENVPESDI